MKGKPMNYFLVLDQNGNSICGFEQEKTGDSIGKDAIENCILNGLKALCIPKKVYDHFKVEKIKASVLGEYLLIKGITPY